MATENRRHAHEVPRSLGFSFLNCETNAAVSS